DYVKRGRNTAARLAQRLATNQRSASKARAVIADKESPLLIFILGLSPTLPFSRRAACRRDRLQRLVGRLTSHVVLQRCHP
ncbi:hypothetical protein, partial [Salmonella enterica]|uniref:hypothetical protein n=1 Tax=Salmonella enterica TaxID=28901 RepID=UPI001C903610